MPQSYAPQTRAHILPTCCQSHSLVFSASSLPPSLLSQQQVHLARPSLLSASSPTALATVPSAGWRLDTPYPAPPAHPPTQRTRRIARGRREACHQKPSTESKPFYSPEAAQLLATEGSRAAAPPMNPSALPLPPAGPGPEGVNRVKGWQSRQPGSSTWARPGRDAERRIRGWPHWDNHKQEDAPAGPHLLPPRPGRAGSHSPVVALLYSSFSSMRGPLP